MVVKENPYRLATDIFGIGFLTADRIAEKLGIFQRILNYGLKQAYSMSSTNSLMRGHVYYPYEPLVQKCQEILGVDQEVIIKAMSVIAESRMIVIDDLKKDVDDFRENNKAVYLAKFYLSETSIVNRMKTLIHTPKSIRNIDFNKAIEWVQRRLPITLAEKQLEAIKCAVENKVMIITGGPGTGKTTIINAILKIFFKDQRKKSCLLPPLGKGCKQIERGYWP